MGNQVDTPGGGGVGFESQTWGERVAEGRLPVIGAGGGGGYGAALTPRGGVGPGLGPGAGGFAGPLSAGAPPPLPPGHLNPPGAPLAPTALPSMDASFLGAPSPQVFLPASIDGYVAASDLFQPSFLSGLAPEPALFGQPLPPQPQPQPQPQPPPQQHHHHHQQQQQHHHHHQQQHQQHHQPLGEDQLARVLEKNTQLTLQNTDLQKQVQHLQHVSVESSRALGALGAGAGAGAGAASGASNASAATAPYQPSAAAVAARHQESLDNILKQMREVTERRKELEREHAEALQQLREKQAELSVAGASAPPPPAHGTSHAASASAAAHAAAAAADKANTYETIEALQSKIRELEKKAELQNVRHEELMLEMASIKRSAQAGAGAGAGGVGGAKASSGVGGASASSAVSWKSPSSRAANQEVQTSPESGTSTPGLFPHPHAPTPTLPPSLGPPPAYHHLHHQPAATATPAGFVASSSGSSGAEGRLDSFGLACDHQPPWRAAQQPQPPQPPPPTSSASHHLSHHQHAHLPSGARSACVPSSLPLVSGHHHHHHHHHHHPATPAGSASGAGGGGGTTAGRSGSPGTTATSTAPAPAGSAEIDRIMAKIEQDNRILAELDKTRSTIGEANPITLSVLPTPHSSGTVRTSTGRHLPAHRHLHQQQHYQHQQHRQWPVQKQFLTVPKITFGPEHSLEDPSAPGGAAATPTPATAGVGGVPAPGPALATHDPMSGYMMMPAGVLTPAPAAVPGQYTMMPMQLHNYGAAGALAGGGGGGGGARLMPQIPGSAASAPGAAAAAAAAAAAPHIPALFATQYADLDARNNFLNGNLVFSALQDPTQQMLAADNKQLDMLEIPGKGRCFVFIAKYSYDPLTQSPNENPEAELPLSAGDYVLVWGPMDEDGFCDGELLDGRRGLVPSNYIQKLVGDDLLDFHQSVVQGLRAAALDGDGTGDLTGLQGAAGHVDDLASAAHDVLSMDEALAKRGLGDYTLQELEDILEEEDELDQTGEGPVPPPKQLHLERQLHKSVLISWEHPDGCVPAQIDSYHVYVDGVLKTTVKATERPRALVEGVDSSRPHRISVRSITPNRRTSRDAACTMVVGKDVPLAPASVKAGNVTSTSAVISWLPANSNYQHVVCVNNVEVRTVKPGVYRHTITGLAPNTVYRVTVRAKNIRQQMQGFDEKTSSLQMERCSAHIDFRTLPKGLPDPPLDIQVEAGPQDGTLLVTWLPVAGGGGGGGAAQANGAPVTGYAVYADGKKVTDVDSPTGDHALIDINKLLGLNPKQVTVRTKSRDSQSADSLPTAIPGSMLRKGAKDGRELAKEERRMRERYGSALPPHMRAHGHGRATRVDAHGQVVIEPDENLSDKEIYPHNHMNIPSIEITKDSASEGNFSEDDYLDRRGMRGPHHHGAVGPGGHYVPRTHAERGRPPLPPHERAARGMGPEHGRGPAGPRDPRDERDPYYMDRGGRHVDRGYRGGPPGPGPGPGRGPPGAGPPGHHQGHKRTRWFVALFDYDPTTMSPNPDACEEELPFNEGDTIKVYGEKDADGFYWGECRGRRGYVPHNMVMETPESKVAGEGGARGHGGRGDRWGDIYDNMPVKKMIALYDYDPQELSPNVDAEVELSFQTGNIIYVYGDMDDDGFYMGELKGVRGLVPSNFLTEAPSDYEGGGSGGRGPRRGAGMGMPGPGARGPPPPPRDGRMDPRAMDRRKDACQVPNQLDYRGDAMAQGPGGARMRGGMRGDRRGGSGHPPAGHLPLDQQAQGGAGVHGGGGTQGKQTSPQQQQQQQQSKPMKGVPSVVPDFVIPNNKESPTAPGPAQSTSKFPDIQAPNLMQKFSEITGGTEASVDNIISKGKELIFMKFGLGK